MKIRQIQKELRIIEPDELYGLTAAANDRFMRLVQVHATTLEGRIELNYCFATIETWLNLRLNIAPGTEITSISNIFPSAFLYENEIHDLFGVPFSGISIDYKGKLYRLKNKMPFAPVQPEEVPAEQKEVQP